MANQLKMAIVQSIQQLHALGWSQRRIARQLGIDRGAVKKHLDLLRNATTDISKPAKAPTGSDGSKPATFGAPPGSADSDSQVAGFESCEAPTGSVSVTDDSLGTNVTTEPPENRPLLVDRSTCAAHRSVIQLKVDQGLSATRIRQDLRAELGIEVSYYSVRRFVQKLAGIQPLPFRRMECGPGEEAQVDFGTGAPVIAAGWQAAEDARLSHRAQPQPQGVQRSDVHARRPKTSSAAWKTPSRTSAACPRRW